MPALTQLIGWGSVGLIGIVGRQMAEDLGMSVTAVFAGNPVLYLVMGLCAPLLATRFTRFDARLVMIAGTAVAVPGFVVLAPAHGSVAFVAAWTILGMAGSATLTTPAFILLNEVAGQNARSAIGALMLAQAVNAICVNLCSSVVQKMEPQMNTDLRSVSLRRGARIGVVRAPRGQDEA